MLFSGTSGNALGYAWAFLPGDRSFNSLSGDVFLDTSANAFANLEPGSYAAMAILHEIGHAIGLRHPGNYNGKAGGYSSQAGYIEDTRQYTVMSYYSAANTGADHGYRYAVTPLLHDIAAVQKLYGANWSTRTGDTIYGFNSNADREAFHLASAADQSIFAVWDAGGTDTFDFSGYAVNQVIDLRAEAFSSTGGLTGNVAIARGVMIENAIGGSGDDVIIGNQGANRLTGGQGNDVLLGGGGDDDLVYDGGYDTLDGGDGLDLADFRSYSGAIEIDLADSRATAYGVDIARLTSIEAVALGAGDDRVTGDDADNVVLLAGGNDTIDGGAGHDWLDFGAFESGVDVDLEAGYATSAFGLITIFAVESVSGSASADTLRGDAHDNVLDGGAGADTMSGGAGDDIYYVDTLDDFVIESADEGIDTIRTTLDQLDISGSNVENVELIGNRSTSVIGNLRANTIRAGGGDDRLDGGQGADLLVGGAGSDTYVVDNVGDRVVEIQQPGGAADTNIIDRVLASVSYALGAAVERLILVGEAAITGIGNAAANVINGAFNSAQNRLFGGRGNDTYIADASDIVVEDRDGGLDTIVTAASRKLGANIEQLRLTGEADADATGNSARNWLTGNDGDNRIDGRGGADVLRGGAGDDSFVFSTALMDERNVDRILDFERGHDRIVLDRDVFVGLAGGQHLAATAFAYGPTAADVDDRIIYDKSRGALYYDGDGTGAAEAILFARLKPGTLLTSLDFGLE